MRSKARLIVALALIIAQWSVVARSRVGTEQSPADFMRALHPVNVVGERSTQVKVSFFLLGEEKREITSDKVLSGDMIPGAFVIRRSAISKYHLSRNLAPGGKSDEIGLNLMGHKYRLVAGGLFGLKVFPRGEDWLLLLFPRVDMSGYVVDGEELLVLKHLTDIGKPSSCDIATVKTARPASTDIPRGDMACEALASLSRELFKSMAMSTFANRELHQGRMKVTLDGITSFSVRIDDRSGMAVLNPRAKDLKLWKVYLFAGQYPFSPIVKRAHREAWVGVYPLKEDHNYKVRRKVFDAEGRLHTTIFQVYAIYAIRPTMVAVGSNSICVFESRGSGGCLVKVSEREDREPASPRR